MSGDKILKMISLLEEFKNEFERPAFPHDLKSYMEMEEYTSITGKISDLVELANWVLDGK